MPGGPFAPGDPGSPGETCNPDEAPPAAPPVVGRQVAVAPATGTVLVRLPGAERSQRLASSAAISVGSVIDTRRGRVRLTSALPGGRTQTATFWGGLFTVRQARTGRGVVRLKLPRAAGCSRRATITRGHSEDARRKAKRKRTRRPSLWGKDKRGRYRTEGSNSVATVRGTKWLTVNRCDGTYTRVREGAVLVRDLTRRRNVLVRAGRSYLARARR